VEAPDRDKLREVFADLEFRALAKRVLNEDLGGGVLSEGGVQHDIFSNDGTVKGQESNVKGQGSNVKGQGSNVNDLGVNDGDRGLNFEFQTSDSENIHLKTLRDVPHTYHLADTKEKRAEVVRKIKESGHFCFDTETTNIDANNAELVGLSICITPHEAWYIPFPAAYNEAHDIIHEFKEVFEDEKTGKTGQNIKYDMMVLKWYDITVKGPLFDTMLAHYLLEPDMRHNMNLLAEVYLQYEPIPIEQLIGEKRSEQITMREVSIPQIMEYAAEDADVTQQLRLKLEPDLQKNNLTKLFTEVEMPLIPVLAGMETEGVAIDPEALKEFSKQLEKEIAEVEKQVYEAAGMEFNIASPKQLGEVLFDHLKIDPKAKKTKTGQYATGEDILSKLAEKHPAVQKVLDYRQLTKLKSTYVDTLPEMVNQRTGRIHTSYQQAVAATGRLSSNNPNLQNIPIRTERGKEVRKAFISRSPKFTLLSADYSQIELRIIAAFSNDASMIESFRQGIDIHSTTASKVYGVPLEQVTSEMRRNAKMVNFGIIYGISAFGLSQRLNIPRKEAASIIENYFIQFPTIKAYMDGSIEFARQNGYVETILGRKRYLRDINSANAVVRGFAERNAINAPIQGSAADMIKVAMINIHRELEKQQFRTKMILQVHDELVFDTPLEEVEAVRPIIIDLMQTAIPMKVPIVVETGTGRNWLEAH
jgi:DNA polymerase-1